MDSIPRSIILLVLLIIAGGFFSAAETAFSFANEIRIRLLADDGDKRAKRAAKVIDGFDRMIVTLLIMVNVIHIASAAVATVLFVRQLAMGNDIGSVVATLVTTLAVFVFSETLPKNIAKANADSFTLAISGFIYVLCKILYPFSTVFIALGNATKKLFGLDKPEPTVTEDELSIIVDNAETEGVIDAEETEIIKSAIEFADCKARDVMTPIDKVIAIPIDADVGEIKNILIKEKYSRFPVYRCNINNIVGVLQSADCLWKLANKKPLRLIESIKKPYIVQSDAELNSVFEGMCKRRSHFAIVVDDAKQVIGILTMEDILEEIVGEIYDESDPTAITSSEGGQKV